MLFHNQLTFIFLLLEIVVYFILIFPWPHFIRKRLVRGIAHSKVSKKIWKVQSILLFIVAMFLVEAYFKERDLDLRLDLVRDRKLDSHHHGIGHHHEELGGEYQEITIKMKLFSAQRNLYLHGFTLFLSIVLNRMIRALHDLSDKEEKIYELEEENKHSKLQSAKSEEKPEAKSDATAAERDGESKKNK